MGILVAVMMPMLWTMSVGLFLLFMVYRLSQGYFLSVCEYNQHHDKMAKERYLSPHITIKSWKMSWILPLVSMLVSISVWQYQKYHIAAQANAILAQVNRYHHEHGKYPSKLDLINIMGELPPSIHYVQKQEKYDNVDENLSTSQLYQNQAITLSYRSPLNPYCIHRYDFDNQLWQQFCTD